MTKVAMEAVDAIRRRLAVEVPATDVSAEIERAYGQLRRRANVPGFRQGRAPRAVMERIFGDQVRADVFGRLVQESYVAALQEQQIEPVGQPEIITEQAEPGQALRYSATVEVRPTVVAAGYRGLAVERPVAQIGDAEVEAFIDRMRQSQAQLVPITDRQDAQRGDVATIDYEVRVDDRVVGRGERRFAEVGSEQLENPGAHLIGATIGAPTTFEIDYPADHSTAELAGKRAHFQVTISALGMRQVPEVDDAFATAHGCETVDGLRQRVREQLETGARRESDDHVRGDLIARLVEAHDFDVPPSMIERRADLLVEDVLESLGTRRPPASREAAVRAQLRGELEGQARAQVKAGLILEAIAAQEHLEVDDDELERRVDGLAESAGKARERVRALYQDPAARAGLRGRLLQERAIELVLNSAAVTDVERASGVAGSPANG
ncbi:MAG: trigger factor [Candidatus Binatia bacterium]